MHVCMYARMSVCLSVRLSIDLSVKEPSLSQRSKKATAAVPNQELYT